MHFYEPESDIYEKAIKIDHPGARATILLNDGRFFSAIPRGGHTEEEQKEKTLYFAAIRWWDSSLKAWNEQTKNSLLVPVSNIKYIELSASVDPKGIRHH